MTEEMVQDVMRKAAHQAYKVAQKELADTMRNRLEICLSSAVAVDDGNAYSRGRVDVWREALGELDAATWRIDR